jgi:hypothetical protein
VICGDKPEESGGLSYFQQLRSFLIQKPANHLARSASQGWPRAMLSPAESDELGKELQQVAKAAQKLLKCGLRRLKEKAGRTRKIVAYGS